MPSYYEKVNGIEPNTTAQAAHVNEMQREVADSEKEMIRDLHGDAFIYDSDEDAFKLIPTSSYTDQSNLNYNTDGDEDGGDFKLCWLSLYDTYLRQSIRITKSGIETISVQIKNSTNLKVPIYAEIRDENNTLIKTSSANLLPYEDTNTNNIDDDYQTINFNFNIQNILTGDYYFVIHPISISVANLNIGPEYNEIYPEDFLIRYDIDGTYHKDGTDNNLTGLEASIDGATYLPAYILNDEDFYQEADLNDPNYDLYFEEKFSSGVTYLLEKAHTAIIDGEKVTSFDTHVKINGPSANDRIDLVYLNKDGEIKVQEGVSGGDAPIKDKVLYIAYITTYADPSKLPVVNQDDTTNVVRKRSLLERMRRVEKKTDYQFQNNSVSRIMYNCEVDPTMFNNGLGDTIYGEGTRGMGISKNDNDDDVIVNSGSQIYAWSIIDDIHTYSHEIKDKTACLQVYDVIMPEKKPSTAIARTFQYTAFLSEDTITEKAKGRASVKKPISNRKINITVKKGNKTKYTTSVVTNKQGKAFTTFYGAKLKAGNYTIESKIGGTVLKNKLTIKNKSYKVTTPTYKTKTVKITTYDEVTETVNLPNNIFAGNDSFIYDDSKINLDTTNGRITLATTNDGSNSGYTTNKKLSSSSSFKNEVVTYNIYNSSKKKTSLFPTLHLNFGKTHIDTISITNVKFKNISKAGIILFKNNEVNNLRLHKRKTLEKKANENIVYPNVYKGTVSLSGITTSNTKKEKVLKSGESVKFNINKDLEPGTYTLILYGVLSKKATEGYIKIREFDTHGNFEKYGIAAKSTGSSNLSTFTMKAGDIKSTTWNALIRQRQATYARSGTIISSPKVSAEPITSCSIQKHLQDAINADAHLFVSNDGGINWKPADGKKVTFSSSNNVFQWKLELTSNDGKNTPVLYYNEGKNKNSKYAIRFGINTVLNFVEYEDYQKCYETPLLNANSITRTFVANDLVNNRFSEWEFARIFMLDEDLKSKVDICISYAEDDNTSVSTKKPQWDKKIFFNQIFADLLLSDFSSESVNYDNYDALVEFDEHNYRFKMESEYVMHNTGGVVLATPTDDDFTYGLINEDNINTILNEQFEGVIDGTDANNNVITKYVYDGNEANEQSQYSGTHIVSGPYKKVIFAPDKVKSTDKYNSTNNDKVLNKDISDKYSFDFRECNGVTIYIGNDTNYVQFNYKNEGHVLDITVYSNKQKIVNKTIKGFSYFTINGHNITYNKKTVDIYENYTGTKPEINYKKLYKYILTATTNTFTIINFENSSSESTTNTLPTDVIHYNATDLPDYYSNDYVINGIRFDPALDIDESKSTISIQVFMDAKYKKLSDGTDRVFPARTFDVVVSLGKYGTAQSSNDGHVYDINSELPIGQYATINIDISDDIEAYMASGISSIGIRVKNTTNFVEGDSIGIGWVSTNTYNRRPYIPYMYTEDWSRLKWERYNQDLGQSADAIVTASERHFLYPINLSTNGESSETREISNNNGINVAYKTDRGTAFNADTNSPITVTSIKRNKNEITFNNSYSSTNSGNQILFTIPAKTGKLFKINTNIPFNIYDLINIEYYIQSYSQVNTNGTVAPEGNGGGLNQANITHGSTNCLDTYHGSFSKGDIIIHFYDVTDVTDDTKPVESFALPSWGYQAIKANVSNKIVHAWFQKRNDAHRIKSIVIERKNPTNSKMSEIRLVLNNILLYNASMMPALGPQMQMRIYPNTSEGSLDDIQIRKIGCIYRL